MQSSCSCRFLIIALMSASWLASASAAEQIIAIARADFDWIELGQCPKPAAKAPRLPRDNYKTYNFQRRFLGLEIGKPCFVLDVYIERLGGNPSPGMRTMGARRFHYSNGEWVGRGSAFHYFPYALRTKQDGQIFYVVAMLGEDVGDATAAGGWHPQVFVRELLKDGDVAERSGPTFDSYQEPAGAIFQGLAILLTDRLRTGQGSSASSSKLEIERKRIRLLLETAWQTLPPSARVAVDADGLPS